MLGVALTLANSTREIIKRKTVFSQPPIFHCLFPDSPKSTQMARSSPPDWRRPPGVASGTWQYVNQRSIADHYDDFVADTPLCGLDHQILQQEFPQRTNSKKDSRIVADLGCGTGRAAKSLMVRGYDYLGIDLSQSMLEQTRDKLESIDEAGQLVGLIRANLVQLEGIADDSFSDAICLFSTLGMIQSRQNRHRFLKHVRRLVPSGGKFVLHVHNRWSALRESRGVLKLTASWFRSIRDSKHEFGDATYSYRGLDQMFMHRFSARELRKDLAASGWMIQKFHRVSIDGSRILARGKLAGGFVVVAV